MTFLLRGRIGHDLMCVISLFCVLEGSSFSSLIIKATSLSISERKFYSIETEGRCYTLGPLPFILFVSTSSFALSSEDFNFITIESEMAVRIFFNQNNPTVRLYSIFTGPHFHPNFSKMKLWPRPTHRDMLIANV